MGVKGASSTLANTDTSGATKLDPASDAEARKNKEDVCSAFTLTINTTPSFESLPIIHVKDSVGVHYTDTSQSAKEATHGPNSTAYQSRSTDSSSTKTGQYNTSTSSQNAGTAPSYVNAVPADTSGPHGQNIKEGGFTSDDKKNASFTSDIGDKNDPGRLAEQKMFAGNAGPRVESQKGGMGENVYEELGGDAPA